ncbi:MAG TPA: RCC1 repeat- and reductase domain-containing protein [Verrucomicrobiae bacterium]|nr:RCC1 repeat- and reductase domain-containing protein [Verrucomicrobiae bacterium]
MKTRTLTAALAALLFILPVGSSRAADVISVWGGARGSIILKSDGTVWTWGANFNGKLGLGETNDQRALTPVEVHGPGNVSYLNSVSAVMGGEIHNVALKSDGTVWCWGWNAFGQLGNGTTNDAWVPVQAGLTATPPLVNVVKLGGRPYFTLAEKADGTIWAWGMNQFGQMGNGTLTPLSSKPNSVPVVVSNSQPGGPINGAAQITCGYQFGAALTTNGQVWVWGSGTHGELGTGATTTNYIPVQVPGLTNITQISAGWFHILALQSDGTAWAWGDNSHGELGDGTTNNRFSPVRVLNVSNVVAVSGGDSHSSALAADGTIWKFGRNDVGELGNGSVNTNANPFPAKILTDKFGNVFSNVVKMAARDYHNIALKADGSVWMWGANDQGQCGDGTQNDALRPVPVVGLGPRVPLQLNIAAGAPGFANLSWICSTGQYFNVEISTNLANGFVAWQTNMLATPPTTLLAVPLTNGAFLFRLKF